MIDVLLAAIEHGGLSDLQLCFAGQDVPDHVVQRLSHHVNWLGVKECTGNQRIHSYADQGIKCWSGNDDEAHDGRHDHGAQVCIAFILCWLARRKDLTRAYSLGAYQSIDLSP